MVYLGELSIWLWPAKSSHNGVLSDEQLGEVISPHLLVRNLLLSAQTSMRCLSCHLDRIEAADGDTVSLLRSTGGRDSAMNCYIPSGQLLRPEGGLSPQKMEEIRNALRELGLDDRID